MSQPRAPFTLWLSPDERRRLEEVRGAGVEDAEIIGVVDDAGRVAVAELDLHLARIAEHTITLFRLHAEGAVEADDFAVEVVVLDHGDDQFGKLLGLAQPRRKRNGGGQRCPRLIG